MSEPIDHGEQMNNQPPIFSSFLIDKWKEDLSIEALYQSFKNRLMREVMADYEAMQTCKGMDYKLLPLRSKPW